MVISPQNSLFYRKKILNLPSSNKLIKGRERSITNYISAHFRPYLESVKTRCADSCSRDRCMSAVREFYRKIPKQHSLNIAFCLCK